MAKKKAAKAAKAAKSAKKSAKKAPARKANAAFMKPVTPSSALAEIVGSNPIPRTEVTKRLWAYIKKNNLQDAKNKRMIKADDKLKTVFGGKAAGQHVRDDETGRQAPEVADSVPGCALHPAPSFLPGRVRSPAP